MRRIAWAEPGVVRPNEILTMHFGPQDVLAALSLEFDCGRTASDVEAAVTRIEREDQGQPSRGDAGCSSRCSGERRTGARSRSWSMNEGRLPAEHRNSCELTLLSLELRF